jgi:FkbM family methyltransferase
MNELNHKLPAIFSDGWTSNKEEMVKAFIADFQNSPDRRYIFGRNVYSESIIKQMKIFAVIDDFAAGDSYFGVPVVSLSNVPNDGLVVVASGGMILTAIERVNNRGLQSIDYFAFNRFSNLELPAAVFAEDFEEICIENIVEIDWIFNEFADDTSREIMRKLCSFKNTYDTNFLSGFSNKQKDQYFESFLNLDAHPHSFLDVGGYDGATTKKFFENASAGSKSTVLEPDPTNYRVCVLELSKVSDVVVKEFGAGNSNVVMRFNSDGSKSVISDDGDIEIELRRIDDLVDGGFTYIKMDIEGAEMEALHGASRHITEIGPILAICVYHKVSHLWDIPRYVLSLYSDYRIYLRHYTESIYETVMYFVPNRGSLELRGSFNTNDLS